MSYIDDNGNDITKKVPTEIGDYGIIYDNLNDVIVNGAHKLVADEEVIEVLKIIEEATKVEMCIRDSYRGESLLS